MSIVVTGGAGFIGSAFVRRVVQRHTETVVNVDALTYAGNTASLAMIDTDPYYEFVRMDICDHIELRGVLEKHQPRAVVHLAAESHVDRSIDEPHVFIRSNVVGTLTVFEESLRYWTNLTGPDRERFRVLYVSTDEVFGSLGPGEHRFSADSAHRPNSPYAASKAAADHLARAWHHTFGLPVLISHCSNNYGPYQFPEKLIPLTIINALAGRPIPVYGRGENLRDWLYVEDHVDALLALLDGGRPGEVYLVGGSEEKQNIEIVKQICSIMDEMTPWHGGPRQKLIQFVADRPGHDRRYGVDAEKIRTELAWEPRHTLSNGLRQTIAWYLDNRAWWQDVLRDRYDGHRLGTRRSG